MTEIDDRVLNATMLTNDAEAETVREYLHVLIENLWIEGETFNAKRPFGNAGWKYAVYEALILDGLVEGTFDEDGFLDEFTNDEQLKAEQLIINALASMLQGPPLVIDDEEDDDEDEGEEEEDDDDLEDEEEAGDKELDDEEEAEGLEGISARDDGGNDPGEQAESDQVDPSPNAESSSPEADSSEDQQQQYKNVHEPELPLEGDPVTWESGT